MSERFLLSSEARSVFWLLFASQLVHLGFLDPINWPKQIGLAMAGVYLAFQGYLQSKQKRDNEIGKTSLVVLMGVCLLFLPIVFSENVLSRNLWGVFGRNNGFISNVSFIFVAVGAYWLFRNGFRTDYFLKSVVLFSSPGIVYGLIQVLGLDFVTWSKTNEVFSLYGNTNFASAAMAFTVSSGILLLTFFRSRLSKIEILTIAFLVAASLIVVWKTNSIQGLLGVLITITLIAVRILLGRRWEIGILGFFMSVLLGTLVLAGFYGAGLLGESLRQYTLVLRFEYWRAGVKMGLDNLLFGLGYDNYGDYFQEYRSSKVALMTGVELTTNNAHNPFVQQFATLGLSGLVVILAPFLFATFLGLKRFLQRSSNLEQSMIFILFISLWSMAFFSIDNLSIAVINWFVLGAILGILKKSPENYQVRESTPKSNALRQSLLIEYRRGLAIGLVGIAFAFSWGSSSANRTLAETFSKNVSQEDPEALNRRQLALLSVTENPMSRETEFKWAAEGFLNMGLREAAEKTLVIGIRKFPRDMILLDNLAYLLEQNGDYNSAITLRVRQLEIEKRNWRIYYYLALSLNKQTKTSEALNYLRKTENLKEFISPGDLKSIESFKEELKLSRSEG